ncbi:hypothetical protein H1P_360033 [Hyella patelloides LEGE 07179]|uniref:Uncharacterized protein n=1 Tax=Hyella patelloides LEGE 07179 TaxID=945734 RepID=A0A563VW64_9CYAN|nr:hypothetical protein H1P_360033 [Hyella patelloides LEGE 07179]
MQNTLLLAFTSKAFRLRCDPASATDPKGLAPRRAPGSAPRRAKQD